MLFILATRHDFLTVRCVHSETFGSFSVRVDIIFSEFEIALLKLFRQVLGKVDVHQY